MLRFDWGRPASPRFQGLGLGAFLVAEFMGSRRGSLRVPLRVPLRVAVRVILWGFGLLSCLSS